MNIQSLFDNPYFLGVAINLSTELLKFSGRKLSKSEFMNKLKENILSLFKGKEEERVIKEKNHELEIIGNYLYEFLINRDIEKIDTNILQKAFIEALKQVNMFNMNELPNIIADIYKKLEENQNLNITQINQQGAYRPIGILKGNYYEGKKEDK